MSALELHFLQLLAPLAFKFGFRKRSLARQFLHEIEQRFGKFRQAAKRNIARVRTRVRRKIGADASQVFFDFAAVALGRRRTDDFGSQPGKAGSLRRHDGIAAAEIKLAREFGNVV